MLHLPNGYEIFQACTELTKVKCKVTICRCLLEKLEVDGTLWPTHIYFPKRYHSCIHLIPKISGPFWYILGLKHVETCWNMYLLTCGPMIKMKWCFSTSNRKILYLTMQIVCRKNLSQSGLTDCKIITIEGEEKVFWWEALIVVEIQ
jgi:hypothetical protein